MTVRQWLDRAEAALGAQGAPDALLDAKWMLADALGTGQLRLNLIMREELAQGAQAIAETWLALRLTGLPLQYAQRRAHFMGHEFFVDGRVLIPRQDTELLCELAIERAGHDSPDVLDLCTGSGAIAISVALARPNARVTACDISPDALCVARENANRLRADVEFMEGDFLSPVAGRAFDVIACNPPYLTGADMRALQKEVAFEPAIALAGGEDGLSFYRIAARDIQKHLRPGGWALFEVGEGQAECVRRLLGAGAEVYRDLCGIERVIAKRYSE